MMKNKLLLILFIMLFAPAAAGAQDMLTAPGENDFLQETLPDSDFLAPPDEIETETETGAGTETEAETDGTEQQADRPAPQEQEPAQTETAEQPPAPQTPAPQNTTSSRAAPVEQEAAKAARETPEGLSNDALFNALSPDLQAELLAEADRAFNQCSARDIYSSLHDCRCIAATVLDMRLESADMDISSHKLFYDASKECPNEVGMAGYSYSRCMKMYVARVPRLENFCECVARRATELYIETPHATMDYVSRVNFQASIDCENEK